MMGTQIDLITVIKEVELSSMNDYEKLYFLASEWVKKQMRPFTLHDLRKALQGEIKGLIIAKSAWGALMQGLSSQKAVLHNGYAEVLRPNGKKRIVVQWISREYSLKQKHNATRDKQTLTIDFDNV